jgi:hypothetical protein
VPQAVLRNVGHGIAERIELVVRQLRRASVPRVGLDVELEVAGEEQALEERAVLCGGVLGILEPNRCCPILANLRPSCADLHERLQIWKADGLALQSVVGVCGTVDEGAVVRRQTGCICQGPVKAE